MANKLPRRKIDGKRVEDSHAIDNIEYNPYAGAKKSIPVGAALIFVGDATTEIKVEPGDQLYFFKTTTGLGWVTMSDSSGASAGTGPAADTFPIQGQVFTVYSADSYTYVIASAGVYLYKLKDDTQYRYNP
jgi:hypothetical protein